MPYEHDLRDDTAEDNREQSANLPSQLWLHAVRTNQKTGERQYLLVEEGPRSTGYTRDDIARTPVAVKPLEWREDESNGYGHFFAGPYEISFSGNKRRIGLHYHYVTDGHQEDERLSSGANTGDAVERLKALAEDHNQARILSALIGGEA